MMWLLLISVYEKYEKIWLAIENFENNGKEVSEEHKSKQVTASFEL